MALDELRKEIERDSRSEKEKIEKETEKEVEAIIKEAKEKADNIMKKAHEEIKNEEERRTKEVEASAEIEANAVLLAAKEEVIERGLGEVKKLIASEIARNHLKEVIKKASESFAEAVPKEEITIVLDKSNDELAKGLDFKVQHANIDGFELYSADKRIVLDGSVDKIVEKHSDTIRSILSENLFKGRKHTTEEHAKPKQKAKPVKKESKAKSKKGKK